ncbi:MAG: hypothetical protein V3T72_08800 [Thermoanaerobaculia bacterium]
MVSQYLVLVLQTQNAFDATKNGVTSATREILQASQGQLGVEQLLAIIEEGMDGIEDPVLAPRRIGFHPITSGAITTDERLEPRIFSRADAPPLFQDLHRFLLA